MTKTQRSDSAGDAHAPKRPKTKNFHCGECGKSFVDSRDLGRHTLVHTKERPFVCDECGNKFSRLGNLNQHKLTHSGVTSFVCEECGDAFSQSAHLVSHQLTHSGVKSFVCDECNKPFARHDHLVTHQRLHSGVKPYTCEVCGEKFSNSSNLVTHTRIHTKSKPYICEECGEAFAQSGTLVIHRRTHSDDMPFACDHCSHRTKYKNNLRKHLQKHEEQKSYAHACKMQDCGTQEWREGDVKCSIRCKTQLDMDIHIERNHTIEGIGKKLHSETQLAKFLDSIGVAYDRDWANLVQFKSCQNIEGGYTSARPDFYLPEISALLNAIVLIGNDEHGHRQYPCDFKRIWNICNALEQDERFKGVPVLYIRFNPHHYRRDGVYYRHSLETGHKLVWSTLQSIKKVKPGVNLVYIHYDRTDGLLDIFNTDENDFAKIYQECVLMDV